MRQTEDGQSAGNEDPSDDCDRCERPTFHGCIICYAGGWLRYTLTTGYRRLVAAQGSGSRG